MSDVCVCVEAVCEYHRAPVGCKPWPREHSQPACDLSAVQCSYVSHVKVTRSSYVSWTCGVYPGWCSSPPSSPRPPASSILTVSVSYFIPPIAIRRSYIAASIFIIPPPLIEYLLVLGQVYVCPLHFFYISKYYKSILSSLLWRDQSWFDNGLHVYAMVRLLIDQLIQANCDHLVSVFITSPLAGLVIVQVCKFAQC